MSRSTINDWYNYIREIIYLESLKTDKEIQDCIREIDESYFGPRRIRGKRGRGAGRKTKVLGVLQREGKVYVQVVPDCSTKNLLPIVRGKIDPEKSVVNTDGRRSYDGLIDLGYEKHYRVHHGKNEFVRGENISIELKVSGHLQREDGVNLTEFQERNSCYIGKNVSTDLTVDCDEKICITKYGKY